MVGVAASVQAVLGVGVAIARGVSWAPDGESGLITGSSVPGPADVARAAAGPLPLELEIPSVGISTSLVRLYLQPDGALGVPGDFGVAGWWAGGAKPGAKGPAVLVGHVDSYTGPAVFYRLREVEPGATVRVTRSDGTAVTFVVDGSRQVAKDAFPTDDVYGPTPGSTLRLITCGGRFDRGRRQYDDNVVVFAHLAGPAGAGAGPAPR